MTNAVPATDKAYHRLGWPTVFILMWSSGYVAGKVALPFAGPFALIFMRFSSAAVVLFIVALVARAAWPKSPAIYMHLCIVGILVQALQFSGLYVGLSLGVSAGVSALIVGLMPILTALGAVVLFGERVTKKQVSGLIVGFSGVVVVMLDKIGLGQFSWEGCLAVVFALSGSVQALSIRRNLSRMLICVRGDAYSLLSRVWLLHRWRFFMNTLRSLGIQRC